MATTTASRSTSSGSTARWPNERLTARRSSIPR
jgi:hypothetical protein